MITDHERVIVMEQNIKHLDIVIQDHEKRIRWSEAKIYLYVGALSSLQTIVMIALHIWGR